MKEIKSYENFTVWVPLYEIFISVISYGIGAVILNGFGVIFSILYLGYCTCAEIFVIMRSCKNCFYYGKMCGLGKGKIALLFVKEGDTKKFAERDISLVQMIPDFLVVIFPIAGGILLLILDFSLILLVLMIVLVILFFGGTAFIRGSFACKYCKQKEIGCPADKIFNKKGKK